MQFTAAKAQAAECAMMPSVAVLSEALRAPAEGMGHGSYAILHKSWDVYLRWLWDVELLLESHAYLLDIQNFRGSSAITGCKGMNMVILPKTVELWAADIFVGHHLICGELLFVNWTFLFTEICWKKGYFIGRKNILRRSQSGRVWVIEKEGTWEGWVETNVIFRLEGTNMKQPSQLWLAVGSLPHFHGGTRCLNMPQW